MSMKEQQEKLVDTMKRWQKIENASVKSTAEVIAGTDNPIVRLIMEIIQSDSQMHYRVQELIANSLEKSPLTLTPDEVGKVWGMIEKHIELEKKTVELASEAIEATKGSKMMVVQRYLLEYLLADETKHNKVLADLENIKRDMYPYA